MSQGVWVSGRLYGREGRLGPGSQVHGGRGVQDTSVCERGGNSEGCPTFMTPGASAPEPLKPPVQHRSKQQGETAQPAPLQPAAGGLALASRREKNQRCPVARGGRQRPVFHLLTALLQVTAKNGLGFPGHTWNSHSEKGFILCFSRDTLLYSKGRKFLSFLAPAFQ